MMRREFITLLGGAASGALAGARMETAGKRVTMVGSSSRLNLRFGMAVPIRIFLELPYSFDLGKRFA
jgi:hypothetical protein